MKGRRYDARDPYTWRDESRHKTTNDADRRLFDKPDERKVKVFVKTDSGRYVPKDVQ